MEKIKVKVNGEEFEAKMGESVLNLLRRNGFHVPTLCYYENLTPRGVCRMCIAEINGKLISTCTTPVSNGMEILLDTPRVIEARRTILQLIFTERNHYCMYCEMSGDCELQKLGYELGLDHFDFDTYERKFSVDNSHQYILVDPNRCVLCRRCVRACSELAGHFVLTEMDRGYETLITADNNLPLGDSSCLSCGVCVQVCPTGALVDKRSAYLGRKEESEVIPSNCTECPVGCGIEVYKRKNSNFIIKIYGDMDSDINEGVLCKLGRYKPLFDKRPRVTSPRLKTEFGFKEIDRYDLFELLESVLEDAVIYIDGTLFNEEIEKVKDVFKGKVFSLYQTNPPIPPNISLDDLKKGNEFIVIGVDLNREFGVIGSFVKRRTTLNEGKLAVFDNKFNSLSQITPYVFNIENFKENMSRLKEWDSPIVIYKDLPEDVKEVLLNIPGLRFFWLPQEMNTIGLIKNGISHRLEARRNIIFFGEKTVGLRKFIEDSNLIIFTPYETDETRSAWITVPIPDRFEREGSFYNLEEILMRNKRILEPKFKVLDIQDFLNSINKLSLMK